MELTKTAKLQIYPSDDEKTLLLNSMRAYADACNYVSHYIYTSKDLKQVSVQKHTYNICRSVYGLPSQMACNVVRTVIGSYKTNKTNGIEWTECKYKHPQMTLSWNRDYSINADQCNSERRWAFFSCEAFLQQNRNNPPSDRNAFVPCRGSSRNKGFFGCCTLSICTYSFDIANS